MGKITWKYCWRLFGLLLQLIAIMAVSPAYAVESISAYALFNGRAILLIDGQKRMLKNGETSTEGVTLISSTTAGATIEINGLEEELGLDIVPSRDGMVESRVPTGEEDNQVTLSMDASGFFFADGEINGQSVTFLVDTGANSIAMNMSMANNLGIEYLDGQKAWASTANGNVPMYIVMLESVTIGSIEVDNVAAAIITDPGPQEILLGMSFLGQLEMNRVGDTMVLIQR